MSRLVKNIGRKDPLFSAKLRARADELAYESISNSRAAYASGFKLYKGWMESRGRSNFILDPEVDDCKLFVALFSRHDTAQQYITHVCFQISLNNRVSHVFRSHPVKQALLGLKQIMDTEGAKEYEKPFFTLQNIKFLIHTLSRRELPSATMVNLAFGNAFRLANEGEPLVWGVRQEVSGGSLKRKGRFWEKGNFICVTNDVDGNLTTSVDLESRKNRRGGFVVSRTCCCGPVESNVPFDKSTFCRHKPPTNIMCTVHMLAYYYHVYPFRFSHGYPLFPKASFQRKNESLHLIRLGLATWPMKRPNVQPCSAQATLKVIRKIISLDPSPFSHVVDIERVTAHIFRRSLAQCLMRHGSSFGEIAVSGDWRSSGGMQPYVPQNQAQEFAVLKMLEESSDDEDTRDIVKVSSRPSTYLC